MSVCAFWGRGVWVKGCGETGWIGRECRRRRQSAPGTCRWVNVHIFPFCPVLQVERRDWVVAESEKASLRLNNLPSVCCEPAHSMRAPRSNRHFRSRVQRRKMWRIFCFLQLHCCPTTIETDQQVILLHRVTCSNNTMSTRCRFWTRSHRRWPAAAKDRYLCFWKLHD